MTTNMEEVAGLLHVVERTGDHGGQFNNIRTQALQRLKEIETEAVEAVANAKKAADKKVADEQARLAAARRAEVDKTAGTEEQRLKKEADDKLKADAHNAAEMKTPMKSPEEVEKERLEHEKHPGRVSNPVLHPDPQPVVPLDKPATSNADKAGMWSPPEPIMERKL